MQFPAPELPLPEFPPVPELLALLLPERLPELPVEPAPHSEHSVSRPFSFKLVCLIDWLRFSGKEVVGQSQNSSYG